MSEFSKLPTLFISHGAPTLAMENNATTQFLANLGKSLPKPEAIVCISAHWETEATAVTAWKRSDLIYDFYGFPEALYTIEYPALGSPAIATRLQSLLLKSEKKCSLELRRGLDHGAWIPLRIMFPDADIPVLQLSLQTRYSTQHHFELGKAIAALRDEGVLIMGSGGATHNLGTLDFSSEASAPWAVEFMHWLDSAIVSRDEESLLDYRNRQRFAARCHPREEHFLPLFVALGASEGKGRILHQEMAFGSLSLSAYAFD